MFSCDSRWSENLLITTGADLVSGGVFAGEVTPDGETEAVLILWLVLFDNVAGPTLLVSRLPPTLWVGLLFMSDMLQVNV